MSAKNKWKKQIPSDAASFRRPKGSARPGNAILIVTEGLVSELAYFTALKRRLAIQTLEIEVQPGGMGSGIGVSVHFLSFFLKPIGGKLIADGI